MVVIVQVCFTYAVQQCASPRGKLRTTTTIALGTIISDYFFLRLELVPVRHPTSQGSGSEKMRINCCSIWRNKALRRMCFSERGAVSSTQCVLTSDAGPDTLVVRTSFQRNYADPNEVTAVILGGGTETQLLPLTSAHR
ncbi:glucose-1-phosphate adenylyltransferase large subunit 2, chloroplastic/amyloplastic-like [Zea mays]|uniref:glucose-1-phosphate adenylyltransferase large subunit 2, chloroplastic/amyloplastic-like n=1 Tax=Zea mays TaxID=4577 RepID=UPI0009A9D100|nr:glucose-1-phosphate adenylyltransferase large subunit 2, chloroplastic/amyloplastic-like [Zea mays]|eukprot:XP_020402635.1 glucose-1-phosphate adenylyltransferase large subunit 2, chloroplastic/amyloplastic-like [Zea mays]